MDIFKKTAVKSQNVSMASLVAAPVVKASPLAVKSGVAAGQCPRPRKSGP
jgi:hypothetical protein